jgi:protein-tyrosine phosphatase
MASTKRDKSPILPAMQFPQFRDFRRWAGRCARLGVSADARSDWASEWGRRLGGVPQLPETDIRNVMVICYGNICRSAFAAPLLARLRPDLAVRGAGFAASPGKSAEAGAVRAALKFGIELESHAAHRLDDDDIEWADVILGMEGHHARYVAHHGTIDRERVHCLGHFLDAPPYAISDPWGCSDAVFDATFARIERALECMAARLPPVGGVRA